MRKKKRCRRPKVIFLLPVKQKCHKLSDADVQRISEIVADKIVAKKADRSSLLGKIGFFLKVPFVSVKKLKIENSAVSVVKIITSGVFSILSLLGYLVAIVLFLQGVVVGIGDKQGTAILLYIVGAYFVALLSKLMSAASNEIDESDDTNLVFGVSAFLMAFSSVVLSVITLLKEFGKI